MYTSRCHTSRASMFSSSTHVRTVNNYILYAWGCAQQASTTSMSLSYRAPPEIFIFPMWNSRQTNNINTGGFRNNFGFLLVTLAGARGRAQPNHPESVHTQASIQLPVTKFHRDNNHSPKNIYIEYIVLTVACVIWKHSCILLISKRTGIYLVLQVNICKIPIPTKYIICLYIF